MLEELREFCEDNNLAPPAPLVRARPLAELSHWSPADPALENESAPGVSMRIEQSSERFPHRVRPGARSFARTIHLQRVVYDIRYALFEAWEVMGSPDYFWMENEVEMGDVPDLAAAFALARAWLSGEAVEDLPPERRVVV